MSERLWACHHPVKSLFDDCKSRGNVRARSVSIAVKLLLNVHEISVAAFVEVKVASLNHYESGCVSCWTKAISGSIVDGLIDYLERHVYLMQSFISAKMLRFTPSVDRVDL